MLEDTQSQNRILIIDDSVDTIRLLSSMLKNQAQILFATTGADGIKLARQHHPQLILLDVEMPEMDGHAVCNALKDDIDTRDCAVIFVTARASMESEVAGLEAGAVDFIAKPLNPPVVRARVSTHLKLQHNSAALQQLANLDGMTGLYNRRFFDERLEQEFLRHRRQNMPLSLAFIDIDHFKRYNDYYGHQAGDLCLKIVANAISKATRRPGEIVARYGGEEFVVILPHTSSEDANKFGEWMCEHIRKLQIEHASPDVGGEVTISVGISCLIPGTSDSAYKLLDRADQALYQAKSSGRNRSIASIE
jgi:diguanylate cyclase (GGDEF)-like protein